MADFPNSNQNGACDASESPLCAASEGTPCLEGGNATNPPLEKGFIDEFVACQRRLYLYLLAQTADPQVAEEVLQNANVVILSKRGDFKVGTSFLAWVYRIASLELLKHYQRSRRNRLRFDDEFVNTVTAAVQKLEDESEERRRALSICLGKLRPRDREIIQLKYQSGGDGKALAERLRRPVNSIYQSLGRIRRTLLECIEREMATVLR